jgi:gas vesicle protein
MAEEQSPTEIGNGKGAARIFYLLVGLGVGSLLGVLFAPKSGDEARQFLQQKARSAGDYAQKKAHHVQERAGTLVEQGKTTVRAKKEQIAAAVEAGRHDYRQEITKPESQAID